MKNKTTWIVVGIVLAIILLIGGLFISSNNKAIFLEEQINAAQADINVAEKRRYDLVFNLVDAVQSYQDYEGETMESIVSARNSMEHGDVEGAQIEITAVAEAYPELKANENYKQLMNELALTENQIAQYRNNYNEQVRSYNKMVRSFPNNIILNILGYEAIDTTYTEYDAPVDAPQDLFADEN
ncbi:LemA family protein [Flavonifractor plautii]|uniref:LemA family protein n=1 Tax=Flavonifractor plautii TaxID=292800 RepID=UPI00210913F0|nr:LemA family protein [Flavonifractor plautii]